MKQTILAVDDNHINRLLIESILKTDYRVLTAENGPDMWRVLEKQSPDLILMDVMMPEVDGYMLTRALAEHKSYRRIPVIFLTAKNSCHDLKRGFDSGGMDYITKPFNEIELKARIKSVLRIKELECRLLINSITDPLTKLYNRRFFFDAAVKELERTQRDKSLTKMLSLAILDIDLFKKVNDTYGHRAGDFILVELGNLLKTGIRKYDIIARYGGEEFIALFVNCDKVEAFNILNRLKDRFAAKNFEFESHSIKCSFSCGLVQINECTHKQVTIDSLVKMADARLYLAKRAGRNRITDHF